jgi:hypothetical protein
MTGELYFKFVPIKKEVYCRAALLFEPNFNYRSISLQDKRRQQ